MSCSKWMRLSRGIAIDFNWCVWSIPKRKTTAIRAETRGSNFVAWQRSASCCKTGENLPGNASMESSIPPAVFTWHNPSAFHLFRSMADGPADRRFHSHEEAKKRIDSWIASKYMSFFRRGIHILPERWERWVINSFKNFKNSNVTSN